MRKRFTKSRTDKKIFGVCGGVAHYFDIDPVLVRVIWLVMVLCFGVGLLAYIICAIVMPFDDEVY